MAGVEWRRLEAGLERDVRRINGVRPEDADADADAGSESRRIGPGSEKRTRFFARFGVAGGVEIPWDSVTLR